MRFSQIFTVQIKNLCYSYVFFQLEAPQAFHPEKNKRGRPQVPSLKFFKLASKHAGLT